MIEPIIVVAGIAGYIIMGAMIFTILGGPEEIDKSPAPLFVGLFWPLVATSLIGYALGKLTLRLWKWLNSPPDKRNLAEHCPYGQNCPWNLTNDDGYAYPLPDKPISMIPKGRP